MLKRMATRTIIIVSAILPLVVLPLWAQGTARQDYSGLDKYIPQGRMENASFVGVRAAEFLTIPVGARGIGLGGAYTAVTDDISSIWWNPAGLGFLEQRELMLTMVDYTLDLTYSYAAFATPLGDGNVVVGGFFGYLDVPDMEVRTIANPEGTGDLFAAYDLQMGGSLAYNLSDRFTGGINVKYIHQDMYGNMGGSAFAIDAGAIYHTELADRDIKFSFAIQNIGTNITMRGPNLIYEVGPENRSGNIPTGYGDFTDDPYAFSRRNTRQMMRSTHTFRLPTTVKIALAYSLYTSEKTNWLVAAEVWRPSYIPMTYVTGTELTFNFNPVYSASIRGGWQIQADEYTEAEDQMGYAYLGDDPTWRGISFGGGFKRNFAGRFIGFSYAYRNKGRLTADNFFTMTFGF